MQLKGKVKQIFNDDWIGFFIENRGLRQFDTHRDRSYIMTNKGQVDQLAIMRRNLWNPLKALVARLKSTEHGTTGRSYFDHTTICLGWIRRRCARRARARTIVLRCPS